MYEYTSTTIMAHRVLLKTKKLCRVGQFKVSMSPIEWSPWHLCTPTTKFFLKKIVHKTWSTVSKPFWTLVLKCHDLEIVWCNDYFKGYHFMAYDIEN